MNDYARAIEDATAEVQAMRERAALRGHGEVTELVTDYLTLVIDKLALLAAKQGNNRRSV